MHNIVDRNANKFALLEQELRQAQEGTETWNVSIKRVCAYERCLTHSFDKNNLQTKLIYLDLVYPLYTVSIKHRVCVIL